MTDEAFVSTRPILRVDGEQRNDLQQALTGMTINLPLSGSAHAELHVTNLGRPEGAAEPDYLFGDIGLGAAIEILSADDARRALFAGEVTALEERYGDGGAPRLALLLQDPLHRLARKRHSRSFEDQSPDDIVNTIAGESGLEADIAVSALTGTWHQLNESDLAFLLRLLGRFDIALRLDSGRVRARPESPDPAPVALNAQDSAISVRLLADLNHQPTRTTVQGYSVANGEPVSHVAEALRPRPADTTAQGTLDDLGWTGDETVPQPFPRASAEAEAYAEAHFHRLAKRFVSGEIICQGEAELQSGREIELDGIAPRFRGLYQVVHCVHRFDNVAGFETHLRVHRAGWRP